MNSDLVEAHNDVLCYMEAINACQTREYPLEAGVQLLSSDLYDDRVAGLYSLQALPMSNIAELFSSYSSTYPGLAEYFTGALLDHRASDESAPQPEILANELLARIDMPTDLRQLTISTFSERVATLAKLHEQNAERYDPSGKRLAIIVHGTNAINAKWWRPQSAFWKHISKTWHGLYGGPNYYYWSGTLSHDARTRAADSLIRWTQNMGSSRLDIIAHSHGGNVCIEAARRGLRIGKLILLGTPIRLEYTIDLKSIDEITNIYSLGDWIQRKGAYFQTRFDGRTLADSQWIRNWRANNDGNGNWPGHSELHEVNTWKASYLDAFLR